MKQFLSKLGFGILLLCLVVIVFIVVPIKIFGPNGLPKLRALQNELDAIVQESDRISEETYKLEKEVQSLRDDPIAIERIARDELGMVKQNEIIYQFDSSGK